MARVNSVEQAEKITSLSWATETIADGLDQFKTKTGRNKSRFRVREMCGNWDMRHMYDALDDEDKEAIDRYVLNKMKQRVKQNYEWMKKQGIKIT